MSVDEFIELAPEIKPLVDEIRRQKQNGERTQPSTKLVDKSSLLTDWHRKRLLDRIASLVDENYAGRSEMCQQFALLLDRALKHLQFPSRGVMGTSAYYSPDGREVFRWRHAWVRVGEEVIDGNVDCLHENPLIPRTVRISAYWGPIQETPKDRLLREAHGLSLPSDVDVDEIWWPELREWLDQDFLR
jgi:hypothetical protein